MKYLYLHGLGQKPDSWNRVIKETKVSKSSCSLSLSEPVSYTHLDVYKRQNLRLSKMIIG